MIEMSAKIPQNVGGPNGTFRGPSIVKVDFLWSRFSKIFYNVMFFEQFFHLMGITIAGDEDF